MEEDVGTVELCVTYGGENVPKQLMLLFNNMTMVCEYTILKGFRHRLTQ